MDFSSAVVPMQLISMQSFQLWHPKFFAAAIEVTQAGSLVNCFKNRHS